MRKIVSKKVVYLAGFAAILFLLGFFVGMPDIRLAQIRILQKVRW
jgi:hypothetical protein